ncbi:MAG: hypothetical protein M3044_13000 [Thermoproteota archaeon]|nr:hypothetical protein [Thermoproteota archaeon]
MSSSPQNKQRRITAKEIEELAVEAFDNRKKWITFEDVIDIFGVNKRKAQRKLKCYCGNNNAITSDRKVLFSPENHKPQRYYPNKLKARVMEHLFRVRNVPLDPTGVSLSSYSSSKSPLSNCLEPLIFQSLEGYVYYLEKCRTSVVILALYHEHAGTQIGRSEMEVRGSVQL